MVTKPSARALAGLASLPITQWGEKLRFSGQLTFEKADQRKSSSTCKGGALQS